MKECIVFYSCTLGSSPNRHNKSKFITGTNINKAWEKFVKLDVYSDHRIISITYLGELYETEE